MRVHAPAEKHKNEQTTTAENKQASKQTKKHLPVSQRFPVNSGKQLNE